MIDRELANEAARNQLRAQLPDLTEAQVRHKGKMIAGAVLSTVQVTVGVADRDTIANLIPLGFTERDPYANVYEVADAIIATLPSAVLDRDALATHLASVRWDNAATRMDRQKFWSQRADEAIAAAGARPEAEIKAEALREAATEMRRILVEERKTLGGPADEWLLARADQIS